MFHPGIRIDIQKNIYNIQKNKNMKTKNQLFKIEGFIGESPSENKVFVNGIQLNNLGLIWDYYGSGPNKLSKAILSKFIPLENRTTKKGRKREMTSEFEELIKAFTSEKVRGWGYGDFVIHMDMKHWLRTHGNYQGLIIFHHHVADAGEE